MTAEKFISPSGSGESPRDRFSRTMAKLLETDVANVDVFSVRDVSVEELGGAWAEQEAVDIRFSAHGSPFYRPARLNGLVWTNKDEV